MILPLGLLFLFFRCSHEHHFFDSRLKELQDRDLNAHYVGVKVSR